MPPYFLTLEEVLKIHENQIECYGGSHGVRDQGLLQSAIAQPEASFGGDYLHKDVFEMAAAYLFHIVENHPFVDGNKRAGTAAALVFLDLNGVELDAALDEPGATGRTVLEEMVIRVILGQSTKAQLAVELKKRSR